MFKTAPRTDHHRDRRVIAKVIEWENISVLTRGSFRTLAANGANGSNSIPLETFRAYREWSKKLYVSPTSETVINT
jgi:hypothetical protein